MMARTAVNTKKDGNESQGSTIILLKRCEHSIIGVCRKKIVKQIIFKYRKYSRQGAANPTQSTIRKLHD